MARLIACMIAAAALSAGCLDDGTGPRRLLLYGGINAAFYSGIPVDEEFNFAWSGAVSPDGLWRRSSWVATGDNLFTWDNAVILTSYAGAAGGALQLTVRHDTSGGHYQGGELQTDGEDGGDFRFGYYETRLKVTPEPGCCVSFFWIQAPSYGPEEIDIEFLTNEGWGPGYGTVHYTVHPDWAANGTAKTQVLAFNPSEDFHLYGFLRTPDRISFTVDRVIVQTWSRPACNNIPFHSGYIMMNAWTGNPDWGGGPPANDAHSVYDRVRFYPGATGVPVD